MSRGEREREREDLEHDPCHTGQSRDRDLLSRDRERDRDPARESDELKEEHEPSDSQRERGCDRCLKSLESESRDRVHLTVTNIWSHATE